MLLDNIGMISGSLMVITEEFGEWDDSKRRIDNTGIAMTRLSDSTYKMRIVIHDKLDERSRYSVLCHELAHIYLGHVGTDKDNQWPCLINLTHSTIEIEAEVVSYIVTLQVGLKSPSDSYLFFTSSRWWCTGIRQRWIDFKSCRKIGRNREACPAS